MVNEGSLARCDASHRRNRPHILKRLTSVVDPSQVIAFNINQREGEGGTVHCGPSLKDRTVGLDCGT